MSPFSTLAVGEAFVTAITVPTPYPIGPVNMYLIEKAGFNVLVDAGVDTDEAWETVGNALHTRHLTPASIDALFLTHHHEDHVGLVARILHHHPMPVYVHARSVPRLERHPEYLEGRVSFFEALYQRMGCGELGTKRISGLRRGLHSPTRSRLQGIDFTLIDEGVLIPELPGFDIYYVPGHAVDHLMLFDIENGWLFLGDLLLPHVSTTAFVEPDETTWTRLPAVSLYRQSLRRCSQLHVEQVFPGHGSPFSEPGLLIEHRLRRMDQKAGRMLNLLARQPSSPMDLCKAMYPSKIETEFSLVASEVMGLLDYLHEVGQITMEELDGQYICSVQNDR